MEWNSLFSQQLNVSFHAFLVDLACVFLCLIGGWITTFFMQKKTQLSWFRSLLTRSYFFVFLFAMVFLSFCMSVSLFVFNQDVSCLQLAFFIFAVLSFSSLLKVFCRHQVMCYGGIALAWLTFAFHIMGFLAPSIVYLKSAHVQLGSVSISLLGMIKAFFSTCFLIYGSTISSKYLAKTLKTQRHLELSIQLLIAKMVKTLLITCSVLIGLSLLGIDISVFSVFAGAIGVGVAFSLQNIFSNYFSGFVILLDRSIKPGDVISLDEGKTYGIVNKLYARYVSIRTREGKEHLIPNQMIISDKLENWSYSDPHIRMDILFKVAFDSDLALVENLLVSIAKQTDRVKNHPPPYVRFTSLIDNAVELKLRVWVVDPQNGTSGIQSDIIFAAWKAFRQHGIRVPYPPREVYSKSLSDVVENYLSQNSGVSDREELEKTHN